MLKKAFQPPKLAIVLPGLNEEDSIPLAVAELMSILNSLTHEGLVSAESYLYFVDDGSRDASWDVITNFAQKNPSIKGLKLSRNFGHQAALLAGLNEVSSNCDAAISLDVDLQQDPNAIRSFVEEYLKGSDVVLGVRNDRKSDSWFKKQTALMFYRLISLMGVITVPNHADYRLLSKRALGALMLYQEPNIFLRATCLTLGFNTAIVHFNVRKRQVGETKYSLRKMLRLALHGITSFSIVPLRMVAVLGFFVFFLSLAMGLFVAWHSLVIGGTVPGWASTILPIYFIGGIQLLCLGIVGEYIGQIYSTVKKRPRWISEQKID